MMTGERIAGVELTFQACVPMPQVEGTLKLAELAAASLHGEGRIELDAPAHLSQRRRSVQINTTTDVGRTLALIFLGYVRREFGSRAVRIMRRKHPEGTVVGGRR